MLLPLASSDETIEVDELLELHPEIFANLDETWIVLNHLERLGKIAVDTSSSQAVVKFCVTANSKASSKPLASAMWNLSSSMSPIKTKEKPSEITEVDRTLASLKRTEKLLSDEVEGVYQEMSTLEETARAKLKQGNRVAVSCAFVSRQKCIITHQLYCVL